MITQMYINFFSKYLHLENSICTYSFEIWLSTFIFRLIERTKPNIVRDIANFVIGMQKNCGKTALILAGLYH